MAMPQMPFHFQINKFYLTLRKHIRLIRIRIRMPFQIHRPYHKYVNHFNFKLKSDEKKNPLDFRREIWKLDSVAIAIVFGEFCD